MSGRGKIAGASIAAAGIYTGGRIGTNLLNNVQNYLVAIAQIKALKWMMDKQEESWEKVSKKQIRCVEVAVNEFLTTMRGELLPTFAAAYPEVPQAIPYVPVDPAVSNFQTMVDNIATAPKTTEYMVAANHWHRANYMARAELLSPGFTTAFRNAMSITSGELEGRLTVADEIETLTDVAENAARLGRIGNVAGLTHISLGISGRRLRKEGQLSLARHVEMMERVSPVSSELTFQDFLEKPENRINLALQQAQLIQNSLQAIANRDAQKAPRLLAELQAKMQMAIMALQFGANKANMQNQFVPNYTGIFGNAVNGLFKQFVTADNAHTGDKDSENLANSLFPEASS